MIPREITSHKVNPANDKLTIIVEDAPGSGGASHRYVVGGFDATTKSIHDYPKGAVFHVIQFQQGPIPENGTNGLTQEALLAIIIDRLQCFQEGPFKCRENAIALDHLETAQLWLQKRTRDRMARGVEGTHQV